jgi:hypothetical protein
LHLHGNNSVIRVQGETAVATTYSVLLHDDRGTTSIVGAGFCSWRFAQTDGIWLITECCRRRVGADDTEHILRMTEQPP